MIHPFLRKKPTSAWPARYIIRGASGEVSMLLYPDGRIEGDAAALENAFTTLEGGGFEVTIGWLLYTELRRQRGLTP